MTTLADHLARARAEGWADWVAGPPDERAVLAGCRFDLEAAERVRAFFTKFLRHSKGRWAGEPFALLDWQWRHVVAPLFGWRRADGTRRFRRGYVEVPKKNGKSTLFAGLGLYLLCGDGEPGAEVYSAAVDRDQASIVYTEAANMVEASPALRSRLEVVRSTRRVVFPRTRSFYRALSADVPAKEGLNAHAVLIDELHAQKSRGLWDALRYAGASRRQPLHLSITTAGYDRHSVCWEQHEYARRVREGSVEDLAFFSYVTGAGPEDDWSDEAVWRKANPSFGITLDPEQFAEDCKEAQQSAAKENAFRRYRLNQWTEQDVRWLKMDRWDACDCPADPSAWRRERLAALRGRPCWAGLDLSTTTDLTALVLVFVGGDGVTLLPYFWVPAENARERERRDQVPYVTWARQGYVEMTPGNCIDYERVRARVNGLAREFDVREVACDRWNASHLLQQLEGDGLRVLAQGQGFKDMSSPAKELERLVLSGRLRHGGNPPLRWMAGNVTAETDALGNVRPSKAKSTDRIDGVVAAILGIGRAVLGGGEEDWYRPGILTN